MTRIVLDTNVVISAILATGFPYLVVQLALSGRVECVLSPALLEEYHLTILKPKFRTVRSESQTIIDEIERNALLVHPKEPIDHIHTDISDNQVLMCAVAGSAQYIITGNTRHFLFSEFQGIKIVTPREFITELGTTLFGS